MNFKKMSIIISLVLIMFMSAIETSIVSLALPTIRDDLNAMLPISLVFTVYFIGIVIVIPLLSELMSRMKVIYVTIAGLVLFIGGSLLSGLSPNFEVLIIARFIQGIGAGVNMSLAQIIPKLAFEIPFRYKVMGIVGSVWGISSILGPFLGGFILEVATWHWLFYINVPIGFIAFVFVLYSYHFENEKIVRQKVDYKGLSLFYVLILLLIGAMVMPISLYVSLIGMILVFVCSVVLLKISRHQDSPFLPIREFQPKIVRAFFTDFFVAFVLIGFNVFVPTYLQDYLHLSPLQSGLIVFPLTFAWLVINFTLDKIEAKLSTKGIYLLAFVILLVGSLSMFIGASRITVIAVVMFAAGLSFGMLYTKDSIVVQESASQSHMKKMMSLFTLTRNMGNATGSAVVGMIYTWQVSFTSWPIQNVMATSMIVVLMLTFIWSLSNKNEM
ncbi:MULTISPECIES: multidrug efflux MFS transporter SdrM [unclassified Staphylococcus]|uniref:multidrug efflux MFS transporter SdrM n=1 Tax=unclassified Staphylococcus TaxID=91994 RepID=UPI0021D20BC1|nr:MULTISPECIES: multidrug efflux MFS transporter SdrM [unclassified Staphylococcus]UXR71248.1 MFS transporter [Staphylococcus sp. IVB6240]UXR73523.1 MFS transporter [Staphylococcus sp. IVB6238]UXR75841.1 MFS transporter [Staphylococcus sp. IVB6233]UXR80039.1 MFS transporter [Staphylococcus sp. IVB6218]